MLCGEYEEEFSSLPPIEWSFWLCSYFADSFECTCTQGKNLVDTESLFLETIFRKGSK